MHAALKHTVFSDESMVVANPRTRKIWRIPGEFRDEYAVEIQAHPVQRMVWACVGPNYKSELLLIEGHVNSQSYVRALLDADVFGKLIAHDGAGGFFFEQDNASSHTSRYTLGWFIALQLPLLPFNWPAKSPDLSPIEQCWNFLKNRIDLSNIHETADLDREILRAWAKSQLNNYVSSFQSRLETRISIDGNCLNGHWGDVHRLHHPAEE